MNERTLSPSLTELQPFNQILGELFQKTQHYSETEDSVDTRVFCVQLSVAQEGCCGMGRIVYDFLFTLKVGSVPPP